MASLSRKTPNIAAWYNINVREAVSFNRLVTVDLVIFCSDQGGKRAVDF